MPVSKQTQVERWRRVINVWVTNPNDSYEKIAEKAGINPKTFYTYRQNPEFMEMFHEACRLRFNGLEAKALRVLDSQLENGNFQAAKYILDGLGYKPTEKLEASVSSDVVINIEE